uniref:Uncharacterized protein n=1 Tax=Marseillevirus LCMAC103 TaxID=2506604 RepID=A0A481YV97_9VIRU|nr:MAG: hypothetical protein LCMAC103_01650 [Marseillevirus LCMAC103]
MFAFVLLGRGEWFEKLYSLGFEIDCDHFLELLFELLRHEETVDLPAARACLRFARAQGIEWDERFCEVLSDACTLVDCSTCRPPLTRRELGLKQKQQEQREKREKKRNERAEKENAQRLTEAKQRRRRAKKRRAMEEVRRTKLSFTSADRLPDAT